MSDPHYPGQPGDQATGGWPDPGPAIWSPIPQQPAGYDPWSQPAAGPMPSAYGSAPPAYGTAASPAPGPGYPIALPGPPPALYGRPSAMPDGERTYPQMLRGPRRRWWRPLLALAIVAGFVLVGQVLAGLVLVVWGLVTQEPGGVGTWLFDQSERALTGHVGAAFFFANNLALILFIPAAGLSIWAVHHIRPGFVSSVIGRFRWRWLLRCLVVVVPLWILYSLAGVLVDRPTSDRPADWILLLVLVLVSTPLQAAGEEYFFRGWILQNVGSWFRRPLLSLIVGTAVSAVAFSAAHRSPDPWILGTLAIFAVSCCLLTWRTGGLEAAIAIHAVNNVAAFFVVINVGGWDQAFLGSGSKGSPGQFAFDAAVQLLAFALLWWQAGRAKVTATYRPELTGRLEPTGRPELTAQS